MNIGSRSFPAFRAMNRLAVPLMVLTCPGAVSLTAADPWDWNRREPSLVWRAEIGAGFSGVAVRDGLVFASGNVADEDRITALDADTGRTRWHYRYPCRALGLAEPDEAGPRATPLAHEDALYTLSRDGRLLCLTASDGALRWWLDIPAEIGEKPPYWGFSGSPLPWNGLLICSVGDYGLAVRADTGQVAWQSTPRPSAVWKNQPVGTSGYTTPQPVTYNGRLLVSLANETQWVMVDPTDGKPVWTTPWEVPYGVNAAQPTLAEDRVVLSGGYGYGLRAVVLGHPAGPLWANKQLRSHMAPVALVGDHLYGIDGNQQDGERCAMRCLRLADGELVWTREAFGFGNLVQVNHRLLVLTSRGELVVVVPDPAAYRETGRVQVLGGEGWTAPQVAGNQVFARNKQGTLVRVDLP